MVRTGVGERKAERNGGLQGENFLRRGISICKLSKSIEEEISVSIEEKNGTWTGRMAYVNYTRFQYYSIGNIFRLSVDMLCKRLKERQTVKLAIFRLLVEQMTNK